MLRPGSTATSVFNLCSATLGAGALSLPYAVSLCGIILGFILLLLGGLLTVYSIHLLLHIRSKTRLASYEDLATQAFSSKGAIFVEVNIILFCFGTCVAYIVTLSDIICPVLELFLPHSFFTSRAFVVIALTIFVLFPISLIEKMSSLAFASFLGVFAIVYLVATVSAFSIDYSIDYGFPMLSASRLFKISEDVFVAIPIVMFAFTCQVNVFSIYTELQRPNIRRMTRVVKRSVGITFIIYCLIGLFGFLQFLDSTKDDILHNYSVTSPGIAVARAGVGITLLMAFPMNVFPCRTTLEIMCFPNSRVSRWRSFFLTVLIVFFSAALAIYVPGINAVFGLMGSVCSSVVCFVLPGLFVLRLDSEITFSRKCGALMLTIGGSVLGMVSLAINIKQLIM